ncbi:MFS transporter [Streptomyces sp. SID5473]|uniref:MFS transporter n=1 Tax=Streptomyces tsukubensis (strain DSM 42081 / NBRC 108919 / NRRL 18488 / 9993) TaxID=1114943 RepID=A0A7G3UQJ6_STRT9|nr:MFS transporter [Streptomyces tsukubensis]MYS63890.1 MFS transporter [Streptomyces sp. SID5473]QKM71751.1 MFS transporter [Streptomyces tsukubensis NRRL18488]TAI42846.1 MFS transporter [Streptomyces tsukubensis]
MRRTAPVSRHGPILANHVPRATRWGNRTGRRLWSVTDLTRRPAPALPSAVPPAPGPRRRVHRAWFVAAVTFVTIIGAAGFASLPGLFFDPLHDEFGWSRGTVGFAVSVNLALYGLTAPFAAALMDRFGIRRVVAAALTVISLGSALTVVMTEAWQLVLFWGVLVGLGSGSMALAFAATVTDRWFVRRRGLVTGLLTAAGASGQLVFLPLLSWLVEERGWRPAAITVALAALAVVPFVWLLLRDHPADAGLAAYGAEEFTPKPPPAKGAARRAVTVLFDAARTGPFWLLVGTFAICGATTNGLMKTHFIPAAHDHGMAVTAAASLLALVGVFDIIGAVCSGWLTDRYETRRLLAVYYALRGISLMFLPMLLAPDIRPPMIFFIVFYGLDWVATVPPTIALCRQYYGDDSAIVFGWVLASHQVGAAVVAFAGGVARDAFGSYDVVWYASGALCAAAALMALVIRRTPVKAAAP